MLNMNTTAPSKDDAIIIIGAGVFGLSTAIHLAKRGYRHVTVFDKQPFDETLYSYLNGADSASADLNKIIRSAYGGVSIYQDLTLEAIEVWKEWNEELASGRQVPPGMHKEDLMFINHGNVIMTDGSTLPAFDQATVDSMEAAGHHHSQLVTNIQEHREVAKARGFGRAIDPFHKEQNGLPNVAILDTTGGTVAADKACRFALHKARALGVRFVLHPVAGAVESLCYDDSPSPPRKVIGIKTRDGKTHHAAMTIAACGGWTPSLIPDLDGLCETTAGSVALIQIPRDNSILWERFDPHKFPSWQFKMRDGAEGGLYGFPRDEDGWLKIGYRGTKFTNPVVQADGKERSVPVTRHSAAEPGGEKIESIPAQALKVIKRFMAEYLPELARAGIDITTTRLCWYNDSFDNHLIIDHVPENQGLMVATAGSGHGFKYLPVLGSYVVDVMEGIGLESDAIRAWRWRSQKQGVDPVNVIMEGRSGKRALNNVSLVSDAELGNNGTSQSKL